MANGTTRGWIAAALAGAAGIALYRGKLRPWMYTCGATDNEAADALPDDELIVADAPRTTRALTINAPPATAWPWLAQIGEGRAGFYSYSLLERAVGAKIHNVDAVHPEWQDVRVGDTIWLARRYGGRARLVVRRRVGGHVAHRVGVNGRSRSRQYCFLVPTKDHH